MAQDIMFGTGWRPDPPDERDFHLGHDEIRDLLRGTGVLDATTGAITALRSSVDLRKWCSPVQFQGHYNTCTAHVTAGMLELLENKAHGAYVAASRLFLYQVARRILGETGDPGVYLRQMMGTVALVGVPPEKYWPYLDTSIKDDPRLDAQPDAFLYAVAKEFGGVRYFRLDETVPGSDPPRGPLKGRSSRRSSRRWGRPIPPRTSCSSSAPASRPPCRARSASASTAALSSWPPTTARSRCPRRTRSRSAVTRSCSSATTTGRRSATARSTRRPRAPSCSRTPGAADWGADGYGWLPYAYLRDGLARDCWSMTQARWVETDAFQLGLEDEEESSSSGSGS